MRPRVAATARAPARARLRSRRLQSGLGLIELLVVILISLILLFGLFSLVYGTRQNFVAQNQLAQLQDNERMAMTLLANSIQTGGYFPNPPPPVLTLGQALPAAGNFANNGQSIYGVTTASGDQISVRYVAGTSDGVMDCTGQTNNGAASVTDVNTFYISDNQLVCQVAVNGTVTATVGLVNGITGMTVLYGIDTNADGAADEYLTASQMTNPALWNQVVSVQIQLSFAAPLTGTNAAVGTTASSNQILTLTRTIDLLNRI